MAKPDDQRRARGDQRRLRILEAACAVVAGAGAGALTHRAVAAQAEVSLASVSYHFPSIHGLRSATFAFAGGHVASEVTRLAAEARDAASLAQVAGAFAHRLCRERRADTMAVFELIVAAGHDVRLRRLARHFQRHLAGALAPFVGSPTDALSVAAAMHGIVLVALTSAGARSTASAATFAEAATVSLITRFATPRARNPSEESLT
jgi:prepilin-type processing-associated H-X9-DG protein